MLNLRRLRLLRELNERGTIAAVADALQYTPSAVSQQLAILEREAGVPLLERAGRGVRLTDAALVLVEHAEALLARAALAEADLAAAAGTVAGRGRIAGFQSVALRIALPASSATSCCATPCTSCCPPAIPRRAGIRRPCRSRSWPASGGPPAPRGWAGTR